MNQKRLIDDRPINRTGGGGLGFAFDDEAEAEAAAALGAGLPSAGSLTGLPSSSRFT